MRGCGDTMYPFSNPYKNKVELPLKYPDGKIINGVIGTVETFDVSADSGLTATVRINPSEDLVHVGYEPEIERVHFSGPCTVVIWKDGSKTIVRCRGNDQFDPEKGLAMAIAKKALGNKGRYYDIFKKYLPKPTNLVESIDDTNELPNDIGESVKNDE